MASATLIADGLDLSHERVLGEHPHLIKAARGTPPPELLEQIGRADGARSRLAAHGQVVRFTGGDGGQPLRIELRDLDGELLRTLSAAEAVALACETE